MNNYKSKLSVNALIGIIIVLLIFIFIVFAAFVIQKPYFPIDLKTTLFLQRFNIQNFMQAISYFGYGSLKFGVLIIISLFLFFKNYKKESIMLLFSSLGGELLSDLLKTLIHKPRPDPHIINQVGIFLKMDSFPSGHVLYYVCFFGFIFFLSLTLLKNPILKAAICFICFAMIIFVGPSRIYLGAHWLTDVTGAYLVGLIWLMFSILIYRIWKEKNDEK